MGRFKWSQLIKVAVNTPSEKFEDTKGGNQNTNTKTLTNVRENRGDNLEWKI